MYRGTTPTHTFKTDINLSDAAVIWLTYKSGGKIIIDKEKDDLTVTDEDISFKLSQEETLALEKGQNVSCQIRARFEDGTAVASNIMTVSVNGILKDGVI